MNVRAARHMTDTRLEDNIKVGVKEMKHYSGLDLPGSRQGLINITMKRHLL